MLEVNECYFAEFACKKDLSSLQGIVFVLIIQYGELVISCKPAVTGMVV